MSQAQAFSSPLILIISYLITFFIVLQIDKIFKFSSFLKERLNINKRSKMILFTAVLVIVLYAAPLLVFKIDSNVKQIIGGLILGIVSGLSTRIQSLIIRDQNL